VARTESSLRNTDQQPQPPHDRLHSSESSTAAPSKQANVKRRLNPTQQTSLFQVTCQVTCQNWPRHVPIKPARTNQAKQRTSAACGTLMQHATRHQCTPVEATTNTSIALAPVSIAGGRRCPAAAAWTLPKTTRSMAPDAQHHTHDYRKPQI
jgi:hypothetical protein